MGDDDQGLLELVTQADQKTCHVLGILAVKIARGLVGKEHPSYH